MPSAVPHSRYHCAPAPSPPFISVRRFPIYLHRQYPPAVAVAVLPSTVYVVAYPASQLVSVQVVVSVWVSPPPLLVHDAGPTSVETTVV
jgi:hypothetical protein